MFKSIRPAIWIAFTGLFLAGLGGMISTATTPFKSHHIELMAHLDGGPVWHAFGQEVVASNIYWGYAYAGPLAMLFWAMAVLSSVRAAPEIQETGLFLLLNILGTTILLVFLMQHLLIVGQLLVGMSLAGFVLALFGAHRMTPS